MKTIKVIDLLNMIANKEYDKLPKYIRLFDETYSLNPASRYVREIGDDIIYFDTEYKLWQCLTDEVEIIEDNPTKIEEVGSTSDWCTLKNKVNELVRTVNELVEKDED